MSVRPQVLDQNPDQPQPAGDDDHEEVEGDVEASVIFHQFSLFEQRTRGGDPIPVVPRD